MLDDIFNIPSDLMLMMKDTPVMYFSFKKAQFKVYDSLHIPYSLKAVKGVVKLSSDKCTIGELCETFDYITEFLSSRLLSISRENAKKILNLLNLPQAQDIYSKRDIALAYRCVSLQDNYWTKGVNENISWKNVNLRTNSLSQVVGEVALHGGIFMVKSKVRTPELTTKGTYAKAWKCEKDGLYLYKKGTPKGKQSHVEVAVSKILDKMHIPHIKYSAAKSQGEYCCKCKCMTTDKYSMLTALDFFLYCRRLGRNPIFDMYRYEPKLIYQMFIIDYLFSNTDRHLQNWGFFYDNDTMKIVGCHPLFDHNNAFDERILFDVTGGKNQVYSNKTALAVAKHSLKKIDFSLPNNITVRDFVKREHYKSFVFKARNLDLLPDKKFFCLF